MSNHLIWNNPWCSDSSVEYKNSDHADTTLLQFQQKILCLQHLLQGTQTVVEFLRQYFPIFLIKSLVDYTFRVFFGRSIILNLRVNIEAIRQRLMEQENGLAVKIDSHTSLCIYGQTLRIITLSMDILSKNEKGSSTSCLCFFFFACKREAFAWKGLKHTMLAFRAYT